MIVRLQRNSRASIHSYQSNSWQLYAQTNACKFGHESSEWTRKSYFRESMHEEGRKEGRKGFLFFFSFGIEWRETLTKSVGLARNWRTRSVAESDGIGTKLPRTSFSCFSLTQRPHPYCNWNLLHFLCLFPVQKPQSKKLAFRILSLRSPRSTTGKLQIQKRKRIQRQLRLRNLNCNETLRSSSFAAFFSRATRSDCRKGCRRGRRTGIRYGSPETTGAVSSGIRYDRSETAEAAAPAQYLIFFNNEIIKWSEKHN